MRGLRVGKIPLTLAVWQLQQICPYLPSRPISFWDSEYGCAPFVIKTADIQADKVMRLRSNLCLWGTPPEYSGRGKPRVHGHKFKLNDSTTWEEPSQTILEEDTQIGSVRIRLWHSLHFRKAPHHPMSVILVERLKKDSSPRVSKPMWLAFVGKHLPPLSDIWRLYLRRFAIDHWYRFAKQRLHWTLPKLTTPKQCDRWSDLVPLMTWELWLARDIVADNPLPWHKPMTKLTPGRVAQAMGGILARISTPAQPPKLRGKSSGWKTGQPRQRRTRYPIVKKATTRKRKQ